MHDVLVLPSAEADLEDIAIYTKERWGREQARRYLVNLQTEMEALGSFPHRHSIYESRCGMFRKAPSGEHLIFYMVNEETVDVVRILHNRMDVDQGLG